MTFDFKKRIARLQRRILDEKLDALIVLTAEDSNRNVYYLSGFSGTTAALVVSRHRAALAVDARYTERAEKDAHAAVVEIPRGTGREGQYLAYIKEGLAALTLKKGARVGFESSRIPYGWADAWGRKLHAELVPTHGLVETLRQTKDEEEIRHLSRAARVTSNVFEVISRKVRPGMREREIATLLDIEHLKRSALAPSFRTIVASGPNSAMPHHETGERKVKPGEPLIMDFGGIFPGGYCSDLTRTIFVPGKKPDPRLVSIYRITREANKKALRALRPGITWKEYDAAARNYIKEEGYGDFFLHGLGHSIGLEVHDPYDYAHDAFRKGTVLSNEPGIYISGVGGIRIEDDVVVTKKGARRLTTAPYLRV